MKLPDMEWYSIDDLARRWEKWGITAEDIEQMLETRLLKPTRAENTLPFDSDERKKEYTRACRIFPNVGFHVGGRVIINTTSKGRVIIKLAEVLRYETDHLTPLTDNLDTSTRHLKQETDKEMCERLKGEDLDNREIAQKLKNSFPTITPSRIGRLLTEEPGISVTTEAYRKRGIRLLE